MAALPPGFAQLNEAYFYFIGLGEDAQRVHLQDRKSYKPVLGVAPFSAGPGDIAIFAAIYEVVRKLAYILLVGRFFGTQEDLGLSFILSAFIEDAAAMVCTAIGWKVVPRAPRDLPPGPVFLRQHELYSGGARLRLLTGDLAA